MSDHATVEDHSWGFEGIATPPRDAHDAFDAPYDPDDDHDHDALETTNETSDAPRDIRADDHSAACSEMTFAETRSTADDSTRTSLYDSDLDIATAATVPPTDLSHLRYAPWPVPDIDGDSVGDFDGDIDDDSDEELQLEIDFSRVALRALSLAFS